jgi:hypothetical protein
MADEQVWMFGGRRFVRDDGECVAARNGDWVLVRKADKQGWVNFRLFLDRRSVKRRQWYVSAKDGEVLETKCVLNLRDKRPEGFDWVADMARQIGLKDDDHGG